MDNLEMIKRMRMIFNLLPTGKEFARRLFNALKGCLTTKEAADNFYNNLCQSTTNYKEINKIINDPKRAEEERKKYIEEE